VLRADDQGPDESPKRPADRSSDGGGLTQVTSNPGGDDVPGSWAPNGKRIVFQRFSPAGDSEGVFVVNLNGTGLKRIVPPTMQVNCCTLDWSPQGNEIVLARRPPDLHSSIWVVHADGSGLHQLAGGLDGGPEAVFLGVHVRLLAD
jgi:hypothetical protein